MAEKMFYFRLIDHSEGVLSQTSDRQARLLRGGRQVAKSLSVRCIMVFLFYCATLSLSAQIVAGGSVELPVIRIITQYNEPITSKEYYAKMIFSLTDPNNSANNISKTDMTDLIRGRGNDSWYNGNAKKKSYRIKFDKKTSLLGLEAAKSWILHAQYRDATLLYNTTAFELGDRFGIPFNHSYHFVELYLNNEYKGNFLLTEHNQVGKGRVDIDEEEGWMVQIDFNYDKEPRFRTANYNFPVMIESPEFEPVNISNPLFDFVRKDMNALTDAVASSGFPENGYRDLINMQSFIDYLMIQEITDNGDLASLGSIFIYKDKDDVINMGPLWDFDCGYGYNYNYEHFNTPVRRLKNYRIPDFWKKLFDDPIFLVKYMERWNEKYSAIASMPAFMDEMASQLEESANRNFETWWYRTYAPWTNTNPYEKNDFLASVAKLKNWYVQHVSYLHAQINMVSAFPINARIVNYLQPQTITLISYDVIKNATTTFRNGASTAFEVIAEWGQTPTGNGGYFTTVSVKPKASLPRNSYTDVLTIRGQNQGNSFSVDVQLSYIETRGEQSALSIDVVPNKTFSDENFFLTTKGGNGKGAVTFTKVSGNANVDAQTGEVEITGVGDILVYATKDDDENFKMTQSQTVTITVERANPEYTVPEGLTATYGDLLMSVALPTGWNWEEYAQAPVGEVGVQTHKATFTPEDVNNYNIITDIDVPITVSNVVANSPELSPSTPLTVKTYNGMLHVTGQLSGKAVSVYSVTGALIYHQIAISDVIDIPLQVQGIYIVRVGEKAVKVVYK